VVRQGAPLAGASPAGWCCAMTCALPATLTECLCKPPPVPRLLNRPLHPALNWSGVYHCSQGCVVAQQ
jgi:hypothetical protein